MIRTNEELCSFKEDGSSVEKLLGLTQLTGYFDGLGV
jgi:hypothetical protein